MSVRRLSANQPASFAFSDVTMKAAKGWMGNFPAGKQQSAVIAILWLVQKQEAGFPSRRSAPSPNCSACR